MTTAKAEDGDPAFLAAELRAVAEAMTLRDPGLWEVASILMEAADEMERGSRAGVPVH